MIIRKAELTDAQSIAEVNVGTWKSAYKGILDDEYLDNLSCEQREQAIKNIINSSDDKRFIFVAEDSASGVIGFASCGKARESNGSFKGELYSVYIVKTFQNIGIGKLLCNCAIEKLKENNLFPMIIWVLEKNAHACKFYELIGGRRIGERHIHIGYGEYKELAYGFM
ncbi:MAG TPA: GNAT family N-acetyltransferase [Clostridiales bacterium]|nr:GNAT family N-acetyltransferase [Clostridiales bacterium]